MLKKQQFVATALVLVAFALNFVSCDNKKTSNGDEKDVDTISIQANDSAIYGVIGDGTSMHVLEVKTDDGETLTFAIDQDSTADVQGGLLAGDRVTLVAYPKNQNADMPEVKKMINLSTLAGKWTSIDRNFEIMDDGSVKSNTAGATETQPYTAWTMSNAKLILNTDTFDVLSLAADSMQLEKADGVFSYKRVK